MRRPKFYLASALLIFSLTLFADQSLAQESKVSISLGSQEVVAQAKHKWDFHEVEPGAKALMVRTALPLPKGAILNSVEGDGIFWDKKWLTKNGAPIVGIGALNTKISVRLNDGKTLSYSTKLTLSQPMLREQSCKDAGLSLRPSTKTGAIPFIGIHCQRSDEKVIITVSLPQEIDWDSSSIFETAGKGERWKQYEISRATIVGDKDRIALFGFRNQDKRISYELTQSTAQGTAQEVKTPPPSPFTISIHLGAAQINSTTPLVTAPGQFGPLIGLDLQANSLWLGLHGRSSIDFALPLSDGMQYYKVSMSLGPSYKFGSESNPGLIALLGDYTALGHEQVVSDRNVSLKHNQIGVVVIVRSALGETSALEAALDYSGLGGDSTHLGVSARYDNSRRGDKGWGLGLSYQAQEAKTTLGTSKFGQMIAFATIGF